MPVNNSSAYIWTNEQNKLISTITNQTHHLIVVEAVAGSAKSSTIIEGVKRTYATNPKLKAEYTVFGNANAEEARLEFGHSCQASTIHAKAYHAIVKPYKLKTPISNYLTWRDVPKQLKVPYNLTAITLEHVEKFCTSPYTDLQTYSNNCDYPLNKIIFKFVDSILEAMANGVINATHSFYLKLYHVLVMNNTITLPEIDILIADEAGDMTQISLDIFHKSPAKQKIVIGDSGQSVFGFMNLVSAFDFYADSGLHLSLSKSFRVNAKDALLVQQFCKDTFDPTMKFTGIEYPPTPQITTYAYITRTNATLIEKMIQLEMDNTPFRLSSKTKISQLFLWPLALIYLKPGFTQRNAELNHLQADADKWGASPQLQLKSTLRSYVLSQQESNQALQSANRLLVQYTPNEVVTAYKAADSHIHSSANLVLMTAHTSKGLTLDSVTLANDMNLAVQKALDVPPEDRTADDIETFKLYYISCTRHRYELINAVHLDKYKEE